MPNDAFKNIKLNLKINEWKIIGRLILIVKLNFKILGI